MWECPDLTRVDGREVLFISPQFDDGPEAGPDRHRDVTLYATGSLDLAEARFSGTEFRVVDPVAGLPGRSDAVAWPARAMAEAAMLRYRDVMALGSRR